MSYVILLSHQAALKLAVSSAIAAILLDDRAHHRPLGIIEFGDRLGWAAAPEPAAFETLALVSG
jgi:hypothetical protein